jgi:ribosomal protein L11 methyltransferase
VSTYPALQIDGADHDLALAVVDDAGPVAAEDHGTSLTVFFQTPIQRNAARAALTHAMPGATLTDREVDDEDWARRSQENLGPIVVGRITVRATRLTADPLEIVIQPSMGFGTGHHPSTRLCLAALQRLDLSGSTVLDVGTGSGVLAIAARALGADRALGVDHDADAIRCANENLALNPTPIGAGAVTFKLRDLIRDSLPSAGVVTANLTGALLCRTAPALLQALDPGGYLILSGILTSERDQVVAAFSGLELTWEAVEDEWVGLSFNRSIHDTV